MSNTILIKRSGAAASVPGAGNLALGELAINYTDGNLFYKNNAGSVVVIASNQFLSVSGNVTANNGQFTNVVNTASFTGSQVSVTGNITGNYFLGNGSQLTGINASNVGTLTTLSVTGNATVGNLLTDGLISAVGNVTGNYILGNGAFLSGVITSVANINNGTSNVTVVSSGGNITVGVGGTSNVIVWATTGQYVDGLLSVSGNVTAANLNGNVFGTTVSVSGNVTGGNISTAGNVDGANVVATTLSATGNVIANNVMSTTIVNTASFTGGLVSVTGNVTAGNLNISGQISSSGNVQASNVNATLVTAATVSATGNVVGANIYSNNIVGTTLTVNATTLTLSSTGNINLTPSGNIVLANSFINSVAMPVQDYDAATKLYVDNLVSTSISFHQPVFAATVTTLDSDTGGTVTYDQPNGAGNGIGATLTTTGAFYLIDTANVQTVGTRILVQNQANAVQNGVYTYANTTAIVRATDEDTYGAGSPTALSINDYFFVTNGNVNAGAAFIVNAPAGTITFGTSNITFAEFSQSQVYTANTAAGLSLTGTVFSAKVDNNTTAFDGLGNIVVKSSANLTTPNIGAATGTSLSVTGNVTANNGMFTNVVNVASHTGAVVSVTGNVTANNGQFTTIVDTASFTGGQVSVTGNVTGGNLTTGGTANVATLIVTTFANITATTISTNSITGAVVVAGGLGVAGNIYGGALYDNGTAVLTINSTVDGGTY